MCSGMLGPQSQAHLEIFPLAQRVLQQYHKKHPQDILQRELEKGVALQLAVPVTVVERWVESHNRSNRLEKVEDL